jgi:hypothetical protein
VCDDVVNYEIDLANAEPKEGHLAALKGGGNNFGIVLDRMLHN